jgi:hypothetical protein
MFRTDCTIKRIRQGVIYALVMVQVALMAVLRVPVLSQEIPTLEPIQAAATYTPSYPTPVQYTATPLPASTPSFGNNGQDNPTSVFAPSEGDGDYSQYGWGLPGGLGLTSPTAITPQADSTQTGLSADIEGALSDFDNAFGDPFGNPATPLANPDGSPLVLDQAYSDYQGRVITLMSYIKGLDGDDFGNMEPLITLSVTSMLVMLSVNVILLMLPVFGAILGAIRKLWESIPFIN